MGFMNPAPNIDSLRTGALKEHILIHDVHGNRSDKLVYLQFVVLAKDLHETINDGLQSIIDKGLATRKSFQGVGEGLGHTMNGGHFCKGNGCE